MLLPLVLLGGCDAPAQPQPQPAPIVADDALALPPPPTWPQAGAPLRPPAVPDGPPLKVFLDPGHGVARNYGNWSALCESEHEVMMALAEDVAARLRSVRGVEVKLSRVDGEQVAYRERMRRAQQWGADVFVSLHSDARGAYAQTDQGCRVTEDDPGFTVLYSDEGPLAAQRAQLAMAIGARMDEAGFLANQGKNYTGLYEGQDGVFVDRHEPRKRIMFLRRPAMPSVIVETHNALDPREAQRWREDAVTAAFSAALAAGLRDWRAEGR